MDFDKCMANVDEALNLADDQITAGEPNPPLLQLHNAVKSLQAAVLVLARYSTMPREVNL